MLISVCISKLFLPCFRCLILLCHLLSVVICWFYSRCHCLGRHPEICSGEIIFFSKDSLLAPLTYIWTCCIFNCQHKTGTALDFRILLWKCDALKIYKYFRNLLNFIYQRVPLRIIKHWYFTEILFLESTWTNCYLLIYYLDEFTIL